ncbi:MAG TPA: enoyl-CoA hydratase/isomerase family protein [Candidatus Eisenbacteria bacterium]|jgi:trans-feruloyl-CoA hydratase/vanillin synthase|nr:enoyl-CoA hydratase/isomerase family protein [Candidatus Eisenbacteria bacterium]
MAETKFLNANIDENTGIAWLTLNRPEKKNALSIALLTEVAAILRSLAENEKIRCIVTTGAGDSYSSGRDLYDMRGQDNRRRTRGFGGVAEIVDLMRKLPQITVAKVRGWCLGGGLALINGHDLVVSADTANFGMPEVIRGSYGATATPSLFHAGIPFKKAFYISLTGRNLTGIEAERVGLVSQVVPEKELDGFVETLAKELASRNGATLENAKIAAYMQKDLPFDMALRADDLVQHRLRYYTNPLSDVEGYLHSQKGGGTVRYVKPEDRK